MLFLTYMLVVFVLLYDEKLFCKSTLVFLQVVWGNFNYSLSFLLDHISSISYIFDIDFLDNLFLRKTITVFELVPRQHEETLPVCD